MHKCTAYSIWIPISFYVVLYTLQKIIINRQGYYIERKSAIRYNYIYITLLIYYTFEQIQRNEMSLSFWPKDYCCR